MISPESGVQSPTFSVQRLESRLRSPISAFCLLLFAASPAAAWTNVAPGVDYQYFRVGGTNDIFVTRMSRTNPAVTLDTTIANGTISGALQTVRNQATRYDDALTWWGGEWGARNKVVAAINGGFYTPATGVITGGQIQSGWYSSFFADAFSGFGWKTDRTPFIGECVQHQSANVYVRFQANGNTLPIAGINRTNTGNDLVLFTPQFNNTTPTGSRTEVLVEMSRPNLPTSGAAYSTGIIRAKTTASGTTLIPFDHLVLSATGSTGTSLNNFATLGAEIRLFHQLTDRNEPDVQGNGGCQSLTGTDWANTFSAINVNFHFLKNNTVRVPDAVAHPGYLGYVNLNPRTALCYNADYVFLVVVDGRTAQSAGINCADLGHWAKAALGATDGVNLDGGGSSTLVLKSGPDGPFVVKNVPSDGSERAVCNAVILSVPQPKVQSTTLAAGLTVKATAAANVRLGPGTNYFSFTTVTNGATGTVVSHPLNGVQATRSTGGSPQFWWKCNFAGTEGWVAESLLSSPRPLGIDVSVWQGTGINWTSVKNSGITFAWVKASQGTNITDSTFAGNIVNARAAGVLVGAYHFADYTNSVGWPGADAEAAYFWNVVKHHIKNDGTYLMPVLDVERFPSGYTKSTLSQWVNRWCSNIVNYAAASNVTVKPVIYTGVSFASTWLDDTVTNWPLWMANINGQDPQTGGPNGTSPWSTWHAWQYSWTGSVPGVPGNCDLDVFNGTAAQLVSSLVIGGSYAPPVITQQPTDQVVSSDEPAFFMVKASSDTPLGYQWQKNGSNLSNGGKYSGATSALLAIANCDSNDVGSYRCVVTNSSGSTNSAAATLTLATPMSGTVLRAIPLPAGYTANEARAITPDGKYVVGFHGTSTTGGTNGFLYNTVSQTVRNGIQPGDGTGNPAASLFGVGWRTHNGGAQLVLDGFSGGWHANFMTTNDGLTWGTIRQDTSVGTAPKLPMANSLAGTATDRFWSAWWDENSGDWQLYVARYSNAWPATVQRDQKGIPQGTPAGMHGVSSTGRAVGWRNNPRANYVLDWGGAGTPANWFFNGLAGNTEGEPFAVSVNGAVIFGQSPVTGGRPGNWGYRAVLTTNVPGTLQSVVELPNFPDTVGTGGSAAVPYGCTTDGNHAVGMSYRGQEKAVLWDTSAANPANWTVTDLTELAATNGVLGNFVRLTRAYSVGVNAAGNFVVAGVGAWSSDGSTNTRAFVMELGSSAPVITQSPSATNVCVGATAQFSAMATGSGTLSYQWQRSQTNISNGGKISGATTTTLTITGGDGGDAGNYRCVVSNAVGSATSAEAALAFKAATEISQSPAATNVCAGTVATFSVSATGAGVLSYQWQKSVVSSQWSVVGEGGHYSGVTTPTLTITGADTGDAADYRCVVAGDCGSMTSSVAALTLKDATLISQPPSGTNVCPGATATFSVTATGAGTLAYQWQKNQSALANGGHYSGVTTATLTITGADGGDAADYRCVITGDCGSVTSSVATLTLKAATVITQEPSATNVCPGVNVSFDVGATGDGALAYQWQTNGVNLADDGHYAGTATPTLTITNVHVADGVNYRCIITGGCGSVTSAAPALTLKATTVVTVQPVAQIVAPGSNATFTVTATGEGTLAYQWQKNATNLSNGGHYSGATTATLTITDADENDAANYTCVVAGDCGSVTSSIVALALSEGFAADYPVNRAIPDGNIIGIYDTRTVSTPIHSITGLKVRVKITGTFNGDLFCYLAHGSGYAVLLTRPGRTTANPFGYDDPGSDVTFDSAAALDAHVYRLMVTGSHAIPLGTNLTGVWMADGRTSSPVSVLDTDARPAMLDVFTGLNPNGSWTLFVADLASGDAHALESWGLEIYGPEEAPSSGTIYGHVQLQGFTGTGPRPVRFVATDTNNVPLQTNDLNLTFTGSPKVADYELSVPLNTANVSAKTDWNLRRRQPVTFKNAVATNHFTGATGQLLGGDISGNNNLINTADYTILRGNWLKTTDSADLTGDGLVNTTDYTILRGNWLRVGDPQ